MEKYLDFTSNIDVNKIKQIANEIKSGKIVIFPTETVYAIGTNALNENSVELLYSIKNRKRNNPINLLVSDFEMIENITKDITPLEYDLMKAFFPGAFTIILKKKNIIPNIVTANSEFVGIRMPDNEIAINLIKNAGTPIAAPSANISGKISGTNVDDILDDFSDKVDYIINGGISDIGLESTIVKVINGITYILRPGSITIDDIKKISNNVVYNEKILPSKNDKHYQINSNSILVYSDNNNKMINEIKSLAKKYKNPLIICCNENINQYTDYKTISYGNKKNLNEISKNIFHIIKKSDLNNSDLIIIEGLKNEGIGIAIMNRLLNLCNNNYKEV